jgi:hypothetical protein
VFDGGATSLSRAGPLGDAVRSPAVDATGADWLEALVFMVVQAATARGARMKAAIVDVLMAASPGCGAPCRRAAIAFDRPKNFFPRRA